MKENETVEFKEKLNEKFEREVVAFLNTNHGGSIYIGIADDGTIRGVNHIESNELEIKDRIKNNISPSTLGLFEIVSHHEGEKDYIQVIVSGGNQKPYYIRRYGMCPEGCFFRIGSATEKMSEDQILDLFQRRDKRTIVTMASPEQDLTFDYMKTLYRRKGFEVEDNLLKQLGFHCYDNQFNYLAYLLSDQNALQIQYARYNDDQVFDLAELRTYSNQSLLATASEILRDLNSRNATYTKIISTGRMDQQKFNEIALREVVINAIVHNDYRCGGLPTFEEFINRFEISSYGGLPEGLSQDDFQNGYSLPRNPELIRVFRDLGFAEHMGTGIRRVLKFYSKDIFMFSTNFIRVNIPFSKPADPQHKTDYRKKMTVLSLLTQNPDLTMNELAEALGKSTSTIYRELAALTKQGRIRRVGSNKTGYWEVEEQESDLMAAERPSRGYSTKKQVRRSCQDL